MATSNEGKTLAGNACGGCDNDNVTMHCKECPIYLCDNCAKYHRRMPATASHNLKPVSTSTESIPRSGNVESLSISCVFHSGFPVTRVCKTCREVICESCKQQHKGHTLVPAKSDLQLLQQIAVEEISRLLTQVQVLDEKKIALRDCLTVYKDAKKRVEEWRRVIVGCTNTSADGLQKTLDDKIKDVEWLIKSKYEELDDCSAKCDQEVSTLNSIKRTKDVDHLVERVNHSTYLTQRARRILEDVSFEEEIDVILPNAELLVPIRINTGLLFSANFQLNIKGRPMVEYDKQKEYKDICTPGKNIRRIADTAMLNDKIIFYTRSTMDVVVFDSVTFEMESRMCPVKMQHLICISPGRYVLREYEKQFVHLLDSTFQLLCTMDQDDDNYRYEYSHICVYGPSTFLYAMPLSQNLNKYIFRKVMVEADKFTSSDIAVVLLPDTPSYLTLQNSKQHAFFLCTDNDEKKHLLVKVNLKTSEVKRHDVSKYISKPWSLYVDADDNTLIGDDSGMIHLILPNGGNRVIHNTKGTVYGLTIHKRNLVVSCGYPSHIKMFC